LLDLCDRHVWIPMQGLKESLNVSIAFSIAAYLIRYASR
jgi:tRNA G18 (ribose-2'-O)-methylase SpoU